MDKTLIGPHAPDPDEVEVFDDFPRFFKRRYDMHNNAILGVPRDGGLTVEIHRMAPPDSWITIYGFHARSDYAEDAAHDEACHRSGVMMGFFYSTEAPTGEYGHMELDVLEPITREEFEDAARRQWQ